MFDPPGLPPAGWYPDPERSGAMRWWTGSQWSAPAATPTWWAPSDALPDVGEVVSSSFRHTLRRWRALLAIAVVTGGISSLAALIAVRRLFEDLAVVDGDVVGWTDDRLPAVIGFFVVAALAGWTGFIAATRLLLDEVDEASTTISYPIEVRAPALTTATEIRSGLRSVATAIRILPRAAAWGLVVGAAFAALALALVGVIAVVPVLGALLVLAMLPVGFWALAKLAFVTHAVVDRPGNPMSRSAAVSAGRFWATVGRLLLLGVISAAIGWGIGIVTSVAGDGSGFAGGGATFEIDQDGRIQDDIDLDEAFSVSPYAMVVSVIGGIATTVLSTNVMIAGLAVMYRTRNPRSD